MTDFDHLSDMQRDSIRRFILSPCPLDNVPKPKIVLFRNNFRKDQKSNIASDIVKPQKFHIQKIRDKSKCQNSNQNESSISCENLTRKDFILKDLTEMAKNSNGLKDLNLDVSLGVEPKYYQKWARNKKSSSKYICPSLLEKFQTTERIKTITRLEFRRNSSRRHLKRPKGRKYVLKNVTKNQNNTDTQKNDKEVYYQEQDFEDGLGDQEYITSEESHSEEEYKDNGNSYDVDEYFFSQQLKHSVNDVTSFDSSSSNSERLNHEPAFGTLITKNFSGNTNSEMVNTKHTHVNETDLSGNCNENEFSSLRIACLNNDCSKNLKDLKYQWNPRKRAQLSTKEISTSLLDSVPVQVRSPLNYVRRDSINFACRRIVGMSNRRMMKNKSRSMCIENKNPVVLGKKLETKRKEADSLCDHAQNFRYKKQTETLVKNKPVSSLIRKDINRIPVKMADTSPRYTAPENIVIDFQSLRIAAHLHRLKRNTNSSQTEVAIKLLNSTKMPSEDKNVFKTVVPGFSV